MFFIYRIALIFSLLGTATLFNSTHEAYVSIAEVHISKEKHSVEISIELTAHDLEYLFQKEKNHTLKTNLIKEIESYNDVILEKYILEHFKITANGKAILLKIIGNEIKTNGTLIVYLEGILKKQILPLTINNDLLISTFPKQQNIVNLSGLIKSSYTFNRYENTHTFD